MGKLFHLLLLCLFTALAAGNARAVPLTIDPGNYEGSWALYGIRDFAPGSQSLDLPAGAYTIYIGPLGRLDFTLSATGQVSVSDPAAAAATDNLIRFNSVEVAVDPGTHTGLWVIAYINDFTSGPQLRRLVPNIRYPVYLGFAQAFETSVTAGGMVNVFNSSSAVGGQNSLVLQTAQATVSVSINPAGYTGYWLLFGFTDLTTGAATLTLAPGTYQLMIGRLGSVQLTVAANGSLTSSNTTAVQGGQNSATFNTVDITVDPAAYAGGWLVHYVSDYGFGPGTLKLVPGLSYQMVIGNSDAFQFTVGSGGALNLSQPVSASTATNTITFKTSDTDITPMNSLISWALSFVTNDFSNAQTVALVVGQAYTIETNSGEFGTFSLDATGIPSAATVLAGASTFSLAKHPVDPGGGAGDCSSWKEKKCGKTFPDNKGKRVKAWRLKNKHAVSSSDFYGSIKFK